MFNPQRICGGLYLVNHPFRNVLISVDPAVAQERPVRALRFDLAEIAFGHQDGLFRDAGLRDDLPRRVGDEALSPELNAAMRISRSDASRSRSGRTESAPR